MFSETFTTFLSDGSEVELKEGGKDIQLTFTNRHEFAALMEQKHLHQSNLQIRAILSGLAAIIPPYVLLLMTPKDLEFTICGREEVDIEILKQHTLYHGCSPHDKHIEYFWQAMESFSHTERSLFLRFAWGRSRLPPSFDFNKYFEIHAFQKGRRDRSHDKDDIKNPDDFLPEAHTCFFTVDIPTYSSYKIMREKLLYAITWTHAIDTDYNPSDDEEEYAASSNEDDDE